jgi:dual specificity phosphatase 12
VEDQSGPPFYQWEQVGHQFEAGELDDLKRSIVEMAVSRIEGPDELYVGR